MFTSVNLQDDHVIANALGLLWKLQCHCSQSPNEVSSHWKAIGTFFRLPSYGDFDYFNSDNGSSKYATFVVQPISTCLKTRWRAVAAVAVEAPSWLTHVDPLLDVLLVRGLIESDRLEDADILVGHILTFDPVDILDRLLRRGALTTSLPQVESIKNSMSKEQYNIAQAVYQCCLGEGYHYHLISPIESSMISYPSASR